MSRKYSNHFADFYAKKDEFNSAKRGSFSVALVVAHELAAIIKLAKDELYHFGDDLYENGYLGFDESEHYNALQAYESDLVKAEKELNRFFAYANR